MVYTTILIDYKPGEVSSTVVTEGAVEMQDLRHCVQVAGVGGWTVITSA